MPVSGWDVSLAIHSSDKLQHGHAPDLLIMRGAWLPAGVVTTGLLIEDPTHD